MIILIGCLANNFITGSSFTLCGAHKPTYPTILKFIGETLHMEEDAVKPLLGFNRVDKWIGTLQCDMVAKMARGSNKNKNKTKSAKKTQ